MTCLRWAYVLMPVSISVAFTPMRTQMDLGSEQDPGFTQAQLAQVDLSSALAEERDHEIRKIVESITELAEVCETVSLCVCIHLHMHTLLQAASTVFILVFSVSVLLLHRTQLAFFWGRGQGSGLGTCVVLFTGYLKCSLYPTRSLLF